MKKDAIISERFRELRNKNKLSQSQMAEFLGVHQSYISKFESNERQLSVGTLEKAAILFGCDPGCLLDEEAQAAPLAVAFRSQAVDGDDLEVIAAVNRIALNLRLMKKLSGGQ